MIPAKLKRLVHYFRQGGIYEVLLRLTAAEYFPAWLLFFNEAQIMRLGRIEARPEIRALPVYEYEQVGRAAIDGLLACSGPTASPRRRRHFEKFFEHGVQCHAIKHDGSIVAYCWTFEREYTLTFDEYRRRNIVFPLDANAVFIGNVFVAPAHRHHGVFSWLFYQTLSRYPEGIRFYSWAERANDLSLMAHRSVGFVPLSRVLCVTLCGATGYWKRDAAEQGWRRLSREELGRVSLDRPGVRHDPRQRSDA
jgi:GNAT superfamily N-acetyltransferase